MCGIAFLYAPSLQAPAARARMEQCLDRQRHRGPDDAGIIQLGAATIGHRRLSIIDIAGSRQPMSDPTGRYTLSYNGEIYNFQEARQYLVGRWEFRTRGDTETLLAGLILEGTGFLKKLEGMWAFALWDAHTQTLLLGRDRMGKKPLYWSREPDGGFACASELPALRALSSQPWKEDLDSTADYLRYGYALPGYTAWQGVAELLPGHTAEWKPKGDLKATQWWQLRTYDAGQPHASTQAELRDALIAAISIRLVADVEVGAFLSGGVDSSLICAIASTVLQKDIQTFTIGFDEPAFDERPFAQSVARQLGTAHSQEVFDAGRMDELCRLLIEHLGQPFADASLLPTLGVSALAAKHVKVALSGDGGDEMFCGYERYRGRALLRWYTRLPRLLRKVAETAVRALPEPMAHHSRSVIKKAHLFLDMLAQDQRAPTYVAPTFFNDDQIFALAPDLAHRGHAAYLFPPETSLDDLQKMMYADSLIYLPQDILTKVDRTSMANSLETRAPFLDSRVVELALSCPSRMHRRQFQGKYLLRSTFGELLPDTIWRRRKQGFSVPLRTWFQGMGAENLLTAIKAGQSPISADYVGKLIEQNRRGSRDHSQRLWLIYAYFVGQNRLI